MTTPVLQPIYSRRSGSLIIEGLPYLGYLYVTAKV